MKITTYSRRTWKGNSPTSGLEGIFASKLKPCICSRSISARAIGSLLTLKLIGSDWRLRLLHFHVNLIKKKSEVVRRRDGDSLQMEYNGGAEADKTHYHQSLDGFLSLARPAEQVWTILSEKGGNCSPLQPDLEVNHFRGASQFIQSCTWKQIRQMSVKTRGVWDPHFIRDSELFFSTERNASLFRRRASSVSLITISAPDKGKACFIACSNKI